jgi:alpha-tubulin suppressor-like RCC1 family protein
MPAGVTFTSVSVGYLFTLALTPSGAAYGWGHNADEELGDGSTTDRDHPVPVTMPPNTTFSAVSAGGHHSLGLDSSGAVYSWGFNSNGQLGDGTTTPHVTPQPVAMPQGVRVGTIAAGTASTFVAQGH